MAEYHYSMTVSDGNYNIQCTELAEGYTGSVGNLACKYTSTSVRLTDRAYRNWMPILDAPAANIAVTDAVAGYDEDVLTLSDLIIYFTAILHIPESGGGGGGGGSQVQADWSQSDSSAPDYIKNKPTLRQPASDGTAGQYLKSGGSGNAPTWETMDTTPTESSAKAITSGGVYTALSGKASSTHSHTTSDITNFPSNLVSSTSVSTIWKGSQSAYDAITTKDANTLYLIEETQES